MKYFLSVTLVALAPSLFAQTLSQPLFRVDVDDGWVHSIQKGPQSNAGWGDLMSIHHPNRTGVLKIQSYRVPDKPTFIGPPVELGIPRLLFPG